MPTLAEAVQSIAVRMGGKPTKKVYREQNYVRRFPRVLAHCEACGKVHTFAHNGETLVGYGCGQKKRAL